MQTITSELINKLKNIYNQKSLTISDTKIKTLLDSCLYFLYKSSTPQINWYELKNNHKSNLRQKRYDYEIDISKFINIYLFHILQIHPEFREDFQDYVLDFCPNVTGQPSGFFNNIYEILNLGN